MTFIKLGTFFASKSQGGAMPLPESVRGGECPPATPLCPPLLCTVLYSYNTAILMIILMLHRFSLN